MAAYRNTHEPVCGWNFFYDNRFGHWNSAEATGLCFQRFYKTDLSRDRSISGNGLGLAIVKKIVMLHHGTVEMKSQVGVGTTVMVHLPSG